MKALTALALLACLAWPGSVQAMDQVFAPLEQRLEARGVPPKQVAALLATPSLRFMGRLMASLLSRTEASLDYGQFLRPKTVRQARAYLRRHDALLRQVQRATGVDRRVVVAIMAVESRLGGYTVRWPLLSVLATQAVLDTSAGRHRLAQDWPPGKRDMLRDAKFRLRLAKRAKWAQGELASLLELSRRLGRPHADLRGSAFGALGMCQFVPTSALKWGVDGDGDGALELHEHADAAHSVANYLHQHGWRPGLGPAQQRKVILTYNRSRPYADTVLALAGKLR